MKTDRKDGVHSNGQGKVKYGRSILKPIPVKAKAAAAPELREAPVNLLHIELTLLRRIKAKGRMTREEIRRAVVDDEKQLFDDRVESLRSRGLLGQRETPPYDFHVTPKGRKLLNDSAGVDLASEELTEATESIRANIAIIGGSKTAIEKVKFKRMRCRSSVGTKLERVKAILPYGVWVYWLRCYFAWSVGTAERHMAFARAFPESVFAEALAESSLTTILSDMEGKWRNLYGNANRQTKTTPPQPEEDQDVPDGEHEPDPEPEEAPDPEAEQEIEEEPEPGSETGADPEPEPPSPSEPKPGPKPRPNPPPRPNKPTPKDENLRTLMFRPAEVREQDAEEFEKQMAALLAQMDYSEDDEGYIILWGVKELYERECSREEAEETADA